MAKRIIFVLLLCLMSSVFLLERCYAVSFSGDWHGVAVGKSMSGKVYVSNDKYRLDNVTLGIISIVRNDKRMGWLLNTSKHTYAQITINKASDFPAVNAEMAKIMAKAGIKYNKIGSEKIEGILCDKYVEIGPTGQGSPVMSYEWKVKDAPLLSPAIKATDAKGNITTFTKNVRIGPQPASLFEIPAGYKKAKS